MVSLSATTLSAEGEADDIPTMRHLKRLVLLIASAILLPYPGAAAAVKSRNPNQRHAKQDYRYKAPKLKYKAPKIKGHKPRH